MSFFDPPPAEPPRPETFRYRMPVWSGPAENVVPGIAALELLLVNTGRIAVWIGEAEAYPNGIVLKVGLRSRDAARPEVESGAGTWRFGLQFSDGRKATVYGLGALFGFGRAHSSRSSTAIARNPRDAPPEGPLLMGRGGGGSRNSWRQDYWLWPLPPPGDLVIACEWPNIG